MKKESKFSSLLKELRTQSNLTQQELADMMSVSRDTVINWESGKRTPKIDVLADLASVLGVSSLCLLEDCVSGAEATTFCKDGQKKKDAEAVRVELIGRGDIRGLSACASSAATSSGLIDLPLSILPCGYKNGDLRGMYMDGDSMNPKIRDGDMVVFCRHERDISFAGVLMVVTYNGKTMVRGLIENRSGVVTMRSFNGDYKDIVVTGQDEFAVDGRVVAVLSMSYPSSVL